MGGNPFSCIIWHMNMEHRYISVGDDDMQFNYHIDVLRLFGKNFKAHMQATYKLNEDWRVWFPKLYRNGDFINTLSDNGEYLEMNQLSDSLIQSGKIFPKDEPGKRIVFAHTVDLATDKKFYKFIGVFSELEGRMQHASCRRIATRLYFDSKGHFSLEPIVG